MSFSIKIEAALLPKSLKFKENELVDWGKKSLKEKSEVELTISLAEELRIAPKDIFKHLKVQLGQRVEPKQVLAEKKSFMKKASLKSPEDAEIRGIDHLEGTLTLAVEKVVEVPFAFKAIFEKKDKDNYLFRVKDGVEIAVANPLETNFGGYTSYLDDPQDISLEHCENKVIFNKSDDIMDQAKINALDPIAVVGYKADYRGIGIPLLLVEKKEDWASVFAKKWELCLYLQNRKTVYLYNS